MERERVEREMQESESVAESVAKKGLLKGCSEGEALSIPESVKEKGLLYINKSNEGTQSDTLIDARHSRDGGGSPPGCTRRPDGADRGQSEEEAITEGAAYVKSGGLDARTSMTAAHWLDARERVVKAPLAREMDKINDLRAKASAGLTPPDPLHHGGSRILAEHDDGRARHMFDQQSGTRADPPCAARCSSEPEVEKNEL